MRSPRPVTRLVGHRSFLRHRSGDRCRIWLVPAAVAVVLSGCGSSLIGSATTTTSTASSGSVAGTALPTDGEVAVAFPVITCTTSAGTPLGSTGWRPGFLLAPIPTALVGKVEFYSDGVHTVLGPVGWACAQTAAAPGNVGASGLVVYPADTTAPAVASVPAPGTQGVFAIFDSTGHIQGIDLVCPFFAVPRFQSEEAHCAASKPVGEQSSMPTPDVAAVTDPAGTSGSLLGSGGAQPVTGVVLFPQVQPAVTYGSSVDIAVESCSLTDTALCPTILSDFEVREFPVPAGLAR